MPRLIQGVIDIHAEADAIAKRPELASRIGIIASMWSEIEDELALIFSFALRTEPAWATAALG